MTVIEAKKLTPFEFHTGFDVHQKKNGKGETIYEMNCPFCSEDEGRHLHFFESTQFGCHKCGTKGNNYEFINHKNQGYKECKLKYAYD